MQSQDQQGKQGKQPQQKPSTGQQPQQSSPNKWAGQGDSGQSKAGAIPQPEVQAPIIQEPKDQQQSDRSQAVQGQRDQQLNQPKEIGIQASKESREDRSKSFGENFVGRESESKSSDTGMIPQENSFPIYKDDAPNKDESSENYKH